MEYMKGQVGIQNEKLLWPDGAIMEQLYSMSRPRNVLVANDDGDLDLLWPSQLISGQVSSRTYHDFAYPITITTFAMSVVLAVIVGPVQLMLIALTNDYNWVTSIYLPLALRCTLLVAGIIALINCVALLLAWRSSAQKARLTMALVSGSLFEIVLIWLVSQMSDWQPHQVTLVLLCAAVFWFLVVVFLSKQYIAVKQNDLLAKIVLSLLIVSSIFGSWGCFSYFTHTNRKQYDNLQLDQLALDQAQARVEGVPEQLSNNVFTLCDGRYSVVQLSINQSSGLFECSKNGEIYSVAEVGVDSGRMKVAATYLGTTNNRTLNAAFPTSYYLYRSLTASLGENELAIMVQAASERELLDNFTLEFLDYWQEHHDENLYLNVFYNRDIETVGSVKDYVLMAALETMTLTDELPRGNVIDGIYDGKITSYQFYADRDLIALNELGANPDLYAASSRDALMTHRHISVHLQAGEEFDAESLKQKFQESLVGGL